MSILVADKLSARWVDTLRSQWTVHCDASLKGDALEAALREHASTVLIVRSTKVTREMLAVPSLNAVVRAGAGYDTIDIKAACESGVMVANCPGKNSVAVAELTMGLMLALDRHLATASHELNVDKHWNKAKYAKARGIAGLTMGLVGFGSIAKEVASRARAFGMRVVAWSRSLTDEEAAKHNVTRVDTLLDVAREADVLSVHVSLTPETRGLINADVLAAMKDDAFLINTARGPVVDEAALLAALDSTNLRAALDVFENEPDTKVGDFESAVAQHPKVVCSHHIGASTTQATEAIGEEAVRVVSTYLKTAKLPNCVNLSSGTLATHVYSVRHLDKVGVLAAVLTALQEANCNVEEMQNAIFQGGVTACATIYVQGGNPDAALAALRKCSNVIAAALRAL